MIYNSKDPEGRIIGNLKYTKLWNISYSRLESLTSRAISLLEDQTNTNLFQMSPKLNQFKGVYDYFVLCKVFRIIRERKHVHFTEKTEK